jgi:hypothetical protein
MTWLVAVAFVALGVLLVARLTKVACSFRTLEGPIRGLLKQGYDGGLLTLTVSRSRKSLQLVKYIRGPGNYGIELVFPRAKWSEPYYLKLRQLCEREGVSHHLMATATAQVSELLFVDFGKDACLACSFTCKALSEVLGVAEDRRLYYRLENATPEDRLVV